MRYSIQKIFISIFCFGTSSVGTLFADDNITSSGFTIKLGNMDPLGAARTGDAVNMTSGIGSLTVILEQVTNLLLFVIPVIAALSLIIAAYYYILSGGDSEKASKAKTIIKWNLIAICVAFLSYSIIGIAKYLLS